MYTRRVNFQTKPIFPKIRRRISTLIQRFLNVLSLCYLNFDMFFVLYMNSIRRRIQTDILIFGNLMS